MRVHPPAPCLLILFARPCLQDSVLTELDIARSLLANQRHQELAAMEARQQQPAGSMGEQLMAFPLRLGSVQFNPQV